MPKENQKYINDTLKQFQKDVVKMQNELYTLIASEYVNDFKTTDGLLKQTSSNINLQNKIDDIYEEFARKYQKSPLKNFAKKLLGLSDINKSYFGSIGFESKTLNNIQKSMGFIDQAIGIKNGKVIKGGYLDRIATGTEARTQLKNYVLESVNSGKDFKEFNKGFKDIIKGSKDKANGLLERYHRQYTYDTLNQVDSAESNYFADELGLNFFVYEGTLIKESREFCIKRVEKVYHRIETEDWKNDPDLIDKKTKDAYNPLIERGRYNCRHTIRWITDERAEKLDPIKYEQFKDAGN